ncbi:MAG TPA: LPS assembly lipoprotein LptE [Gallionella sp.]
MRVLIMLGMMVLAGCGFHLRGQAGMPFKTMYISIATPGSPFVMELRRNLAANKVVLVDNAESAEVILEIVSEESDKQVLTLGADGRANEFRLIYRVSLRAYDLKQQTWLPAQDLEQLRDFSYDDAHVLAKESEELQLQRNMQSEMVQQLLRRLSNAKPQLAQ